MSSYITYSTMAIMNPELWTAWDSRRLIATTTPLGRSAKASETVSYRVTLPFSVPVISTRLMHRWGKSQCRKRCASAIVLQKSTCEKPCPITKSIRKSRGPKCPYIYWNLSFPGCLIVHCYLGVWCLDSYITHTYIYIYMYIYIYTYILERFSKQPNLAERRIEPVTLRQLGQRARNSHGPPTYLRAKQSRCQDIKA